MSIPNESDFHHGLLTLAGDGTKHALGLWEGSTENATVCQSLLSNLQSRGLRTDRSLLVLLDGSKALRKAVRETFGDVALVQRCQIHKLRNILDHLPERQRPWVKAIVQRASSVATILQYDQCGGETDQSHASRQTQRQALARWADGVR